MAHGYTRGTASDTEWLTLGIGGIELIRYRVQ
jgi:hypothetical protein